MAAREAIVMARVPSSHGDVGTHTDASQYLLNPTHGHDLAGSYQHHHILHDAPAGYFRQLCKQPG